MGITQTKIVRYRFECDSCGNAAEVTIGDTAKDGIVIQGIASALRSCGFHKTRWSVLCKECFEKERAGADLAVTSDID